MKTGHLKAPIKTSSNSIWIVISVDGADQPFSTNVAGISENTVWEFPHRTVLNLNDISTAYLYFTLCTYGPDQTVVALARSRVCLRHFPNGSPKTFTFPLMSANNSADETMSLTLCATLSSLPQQIPQNDLQFPSQDAFNSFNSSSLNSFNSNSTDFQF